MKARFLIALFAALLPASVDAAAVTIEVRGADGRPLADAVVTIESGMMPPAPVRGPYVMAQQNISFQPHVLVVPVGGSVVFPNRDKVRHHVYSFSKAKRFDLKLYGREEQRVVVFDKPGVVALGCNIHDTMNGFVFVTAARFAAVSDADGRVSFADVPPGKATLAIWHPAIHAPDNRQAQPIGIAPGGLTTKVAVRP